MSNEERKELIRVNPSKALEQVIADGPVAAFKASYDRRAGFKEIFWNDGKFGIRIVIAGGFAAVSVLLYPKSAAHAVQIFAGDRFKWSANTVEILQGLFGTSGTLLNTLLGLNCYLDVEQRLVEFISRVFPFLRKKDIRAQLQYSVMTCKSAVIDSLRLVRQLGVTIGSLLPSYFVGVRSGGLSPALSAATAAANGGPNFIGVAGVGFPAALTPVCFSPTLIQKAQETFVRHLELQLARLLKRSKLEIESKLRECFGASNSQPSVADFLSKMFHLGDAAFDAAGTDESQPKIIDVTIAKPVGATVTVAHTQLDEEVYRGEATPDAARDALEKFYVLIQHEAPERRARKLFRWLISAISVLGVSGYGLATFYGMIGDTATASLPTWVLAVVSGVLAFYAQGGLAYVAAKAVGAGLFAGKTLVDFVAGMATPKVFGALIALIALASGGTLAGANVLNWMTLTSTEIVADAFAGMGAASAIITNAFFSYKLSEIFTNACASYWASSEKRRVVNTVGELRKMIHLFRTMSPQNFEEVMVEACDGKLKLSAQLSGLFTRNFSWQENFEFCNTRLGKALAEKVEICIEKWDPLPGDNVTIISGDQPIVVSKQKFAEALSQPFTVLGASSRLADRVMHSADSAVRTVSKLLGRQSSDHPESSYGPAMV